MYTNWMKTLSSQAFYSRLDFSFFSIYIFASKDRNIFSFIQFSAPSIDNNFPFPVRVWGFLYKLVWTTGNTQLMQEEPT